MTVYKVKRDWAYTQLRVKYHIFTGRSFFGWQKIEKKTDIIY
jgi:hypothetical protein